MRQRSVLAAFNRGRVSALGLARVEDIKRIALSAEVMTNFMPRVLGSMMLRPGWGHVGSTRSNAAAVHVPFVFSTDDSAILELTASVMRVRIDDDLVERGAVSTAVTNGTFTSDVASWTDADEAGATSAWATGGYLSLVGTGTNAAIRRQQVTVGAADQGDEHALRIVIQRGPVVLRVGSSSGADDYISETTLGTGTHSLAFTPSGNFWIEFQNRRIPASLVDSVAVEGSGTVELPTPWGAADLSLVRWDDSQSADVIYVACKGYQQRKIERRATRSWSIVIYEPEDGPFRIQNVGPKTITASALTGDITLTASAALFRSTHAPSANSSGALFRLTSEGQTVSADIGAEDTFTDSIRVTGIDASRAFSISLTGTWSATVTLQRSFDDGASWVDVTTYASNQTITYDDGLDNQDIRYRIGVKTGDYTSGTLEAELAITTGSITGVVRITGFTNSTSVSARVLKALGGTTATDEWAEGLWSDYRGWPTAGCLYEGRMWWAGKDKIVGSVSDAFESFDPDTEGDSGPINRSIGSGPVDDIGWLLPLQRLLVGTEGAEVSARSSSLDEPLTPTSFNLKEASTQGAALVAAVKVDSRGIYVQRGGVRIYELMYDPSLETNDYTSVDLTQLIPEMGEPAVVKVAIQRQPDTRIHAIRSDGTVALGVIEKAENVLCWLDIETDGDVEDVVILPGGVEDAVYYTVKRTLASGTVRYLEKWALESECQGGALNKQADSFVVYTGAATTVITGLSHLEGKTVVAWTNGTCPEDENGDIKTYVVSSGQITLDTPSTNVVVGLGYTAQWKNAKLAIAMALGTSLTQKKAIGELGLIARNLHPKGLKYGRDFDNLDDLPQVYESAPVDTDAVFDTYDVQPFVFPGQWNTDSRLCLQAQAPRPATLLAAVMTVESGS